MGQNTRLSTAGRSYAAAHEAHYGSKDLRHALGLYEDIMAAHPETAEAGYSHSQILNIAKTAVPKQELLDAQVALALSHLVNVETVQRAPGPSQADSSESPR